MYGGRRTGLIESRYRPVHVGIHDPDWGGVIPAVARDILTAMHTPLPPFPWPGPGSTSGTHAPNRHTPQALILPSIARVPYTCQVKGEERVGGVLAPHHTDNGMRYT